MSRLIDADALRQVLEVYSEKDSLGHTPVQLCDAMPTVDAVPAHMVKRMRDAQKRYFKTRDVNALNESKMCEKEIDRLISDNGAVQSRLF